MHTIDDRINCILDERVARRVKGMCPQSAMPALPQDANIFQVGVGQLRRVIHVVTSTQDSRSLRPVLTGTLARGGEPVGPMVHHVLEEPCEARERHAEALRGKL